MSTFKYKPKKQLHKKKKDTNINTTLDMRHKQKMKYFDNRKLDLPKLKKELEDFQEELNQYDNINYCDCTFNEISRKAELKNTIDNLKIEINNIENNFEEMQYYSNTLGLLVDYYSIIEDDVSSNSKRGDSGVSIMDFLSKKKEANEEESEKSKSNSRATIYDNYLLIIDGCRLKKKEYSCIKYCEHCNTEKILSACDGMFICTKCGDCEMAIVDSDRPNYKDPSKDTSTYAYKRINHFNEWLNQFQAKESTEIPKDVYDKVLLEINRLRITNLAELSADKMRKILKKLRLNKYYEHIPHIINKLNGLPPPKLSRETERKLRHMFREIQEPFTLYRPKGRKNFLSYSYILHKFCELLELDEFLPCFPLLKSHEKLLQQDKVWKKICQHVNWEFYPSC
ncbi:Poxvirus Late Transcription Factor VLTF3 like [seawater metagenome]|uniref:Poxvirus Late Transcription Factor VLTF3 like n=1 Tax=seawater metagenome TaxID=1561972 RepID=A0A5E8CHP0_9ZZZZ